MDQTGPTPTVKLSLVSEIHKVIKAHGTYYFIPLYLLETVVYMSGMCYQWNSTVNCLDNLFYFCFTLAHVDTSSLPAEQPHSFQINFNSLYTALCEQQRSDQATLLLYTLLHQNANMRTYMLSRTDMDNLVGGKANITNFFLLFFNL